MGYVLYFFLTYTGIGLQDRYLDTIFHHLGSNAEGVLDFSIHAQGVSLNLVPFA